MQHYSNSCHFHSGDSLYQPEHSEPVDYRHCTTLGEHFSQFPDWHYPTFCCSCHSARFGFSIRDPTDDERVSPKREYQRLTLRYFHLRQYFRSISTRALAHPNLWRAPHLAYFWRCAFCCILVGIAPALATVFRYCPDLAGLAARPAQRDPLFAVREGIAL